MAKFKSIPHFVEAITFKQFVKFAKENSDHPHWSFIYNGQPITHENDECYLIPNLCGNYPVSEFTPNDMLVTDRKRQLKVYTIENFKKEYEEVKN